MDNKMKIPVGNNEPIPKPKRGMSLRK